MTYFEAWRYALNAYIKDPTRKEVLFHDENVVIVEDKYPKALYHFLVIPKKKILDVSKLSKEHIDLVEHMRVVALEHIKVIEDVSSPFDMGFHAIPSLEQLHMHVISTDFESSHLKHKKHWNSFNTEFFLKVDYVIETLKSQGKIEIDVVKYKELLDLPAPLKKRVKKTVK